MRKTTKIHLVAVGLLFCHSLSVAQNHKVDRVKTGGLILKEQADTLCLDMKLFTENLSLGKMERLLVTPRLVGRDGNSQAFTSWVLAGKMRKKLDARKALLAKRPAPESLTGYSYHERIPFVSWMEQAQLVLEGSVCGCGNVPREKYTRILADSVQLEPKLPAHRYVMQPVANFIVPEAEPIKQRAETGSAKIEFMSGKWAILPEYKGNAAELEKINSAIRQVLADSLAKVNSITLTAFSSPEGAYASNKKLSLARADALKSYIQTHNALGGVEVITHAVAEDWSGVENLLKVSNLSNKETFLKILDSQADPDVREQRFRAVNKGVTWQMMTRDWFPQLRRTDYTFHYSVKDFTVEQGRRIIQTRPGQMSLNEMFHVANSYPVGSAEFNEVFDIAVRLFPDNPVANINAAAVAIRQGDARLAFKYLERVKNNSLAYNNWAAYYLLTDNLEQAKEALSKAPQTLEAVTHNLNEIKTKERDNALFEKYSK